MAAEIWKLIPDTHYEVSTCGRVRSLDVEYPHPRNSTKTWFRKGRILNPTTVLGYAVVSMVIKGIKKCVKVHRLVGEAFIENPLKKPLINHKDKDRLNNEVNNLEWTDSRENTLHGLISFERTSKYPGVSWKTANHKWVSQIQIDNKKIHLGIFNTEEEAYNTYLKALDDNKLDNKYR